MKDSKQELGSLAKSLLCLGGAVCFFALVFVTSLFISHDRHLAGNRNDSLPNDIAINMPPMDDGGFYEFFDRNGNYQVGSAVLIDGVRVVFLDYDTDGHGYDSLFDLSDGFRIIRAYFRLQNQSDKTVALGSTDFKCLNGDSNFERLYVGANDSLMTLTSLEPGESTEGWVYYEVPKNTSIFLVDYHDTVFVVEGAVQLS